MNSESKYLVDLIFAKLTKHKYRKINLEKKEFKKFILSLINND